MKLSTAAILAGLLALIGFLEVGFFGSDIQGTAKHDISVGFWLLTVVALVALAVIGVLALMRRFRTRPNAG